MNYRHHYKASLPYSLAKWKSHIKQYRNANDLRTNCEKSTQFY